VHHPDGVTAAWLAQQQVEIDTPTGRLPARVQLGPFYDPSRSRILAQA
jgi:hypothetical protein